MPALDARTFATINAHLDVGRKHPPLLSPGGFIPAYIRAIPAFILSVSIEFTLALDARTFETINT